MVDKLLLIADWDRFLLICMYVYMCVFMVIQAMYRYTVFAYQYLQIDAKI